MVEATTKAPRTGALKVQVEDIDRRIVSISQLVEALQSDIEEINAGMKVLQDAQQAPQDPQNTDEDVVVVVERLGKSEEKVEVLEQYIKMFNTFLNTSMITNAVDPSAEASLNEVLDKSPV